MEHHPPWTAEENRRICALNIVLALVDKAILRPLPGDDIAAIINAASCIEGYIRDGARPEARPTE